MARPLELPPRSDQSYVAFTDASGGRHDAFTLAICHKVGSTNPFYVCDVVRGRHPPFDPESVVAEYVSLCKSYGISSIIGDAYGAEWVFSAFNAAG